MHTVAVTGCENIVAVIVGTGAAITDTRTGRIPNWLTLPAMCLGLLLHSISGNEVSVVASLVGFAAAGAVPWLLYRFTKRRAIGGGDVKLFAALGALLGPVHGLEVQLTSFGLLALLALVALTYRGQLWAVLRNAFQLALNPLLPRNWRSGVETASLTEFRMGPAIAVAVFADTTITYFHGFMPWLG
jgi:prepilin peptidase CpaA